LTIEAHVAQSQSTGAAMTHFTSFTLAIACTLSAAFAQEDASIIFEELADTQLGAILKDRQTELEKRTGGPLRGHDWWLWGLSAFDYDLDGDLDLIVCIHGSTNGLIIRNLWKQTGRIVFEDATKELGVDGFVPSTDNYPLVWDFDGDGYLDIAGLLDDRPTPCLLNRGGERFEKAAFSLHPINYPDAVEDLNGDGYLDIHQTRRGRTVRFIYDQQSGAFTKSEADAAPPVELPPGVQSEIAALREVQDNRFMKLAYLQADLNGDGRSDCAVRAFAGYSGDRRGWYLVQNADGKYEDATEAMGLPRDGAPLLVQDVDRDGDADLLIASGDEAGLYLNDGKGSFTPRPGPLSDFLKRRCPYLHVVFSVDLDNDGDQDLAVSNRRYGQQKVFENRGDGRFVVAFESRGWDADPLVLRDINDDGLVDLVIGGAGGKENIGVFLNRTPGSPGSGRFCKLLLRMEPPNVYAVGTRVEVFRAGGLDRDGSPPLLFEKASPDGAPVHIGLGDDAAFDLRVTFPGRPAVEHRRVTARAKLTVTPAGVR
jgi:hypothetical protein